MDLYQAIGGAASCSELSASFYARVARDPVLRPLFPGKTLKCATEEFAAFLVQFLGGPAADAERRWWLSLRESHQRFKIGQPERDAWMKNMLQTLDESPLEKPARIALRDLFERSSAYLVNTGPTPAVAEEGGDAEIRGRWRAQLALDEAAGPFAAARRIERWN